MNENIMNRMEVIGFSKTSIEDAVQKAVEKVAEDHKNVRWFEIIDLRGDVCDSLLCTWRVTVKVGFEMK